MQIPRSISNEEFLFGDFDNDGISNIDDKYPNDPSKRIPINKELRLGDELQTLKSYADMHSPLLKTFSGIIKHKLNVPEDRISSRVKHEISIMNKLRKKYLKEVTDVAGMRILAKDFDELERFEQGLRTFFTNSTDGYDEKNYYKKQLPNNPCYRGSHFVSKYNGLHVEVQLQTERVHQVADKFHKIYKKNPDPKSKESDAFCRLMNIADLSDRNDENALKTWKSIGDLSTSHFRNPPTSVLYYKRIDERE